MRCTHNYSWPACQCSYACTASKTRLEESEYYLIMAHHYLLLPEILILPKSQPNFLRPTLISSKNTFTPPSFLLLNAPFSRKYSPGRNDDITLPTAKNILFQHPPSPFSIAGDHHQQHRKRHMTVQIQPTHRSITYQSATDGNTTRSKASKNSSLTTGGLKLEMVQVKLPATRNIS